MNHFYLTLPSNSSEKYYQNNTATNFTTKLAKRIELDQQFKWEVGLSEIILPQSWYNITSDDVISVYCSNCMHTTDTSTNQQALLDTTTVRSYDKKLRLHPGFYPTVKKLIDHINNMVDKHFNEAIEEWDDPSKNIRGLKIQKDFWPKFQYSEIKKKTSITLHGKMVISLSDNLTEILGFGQTVLNNDTNEDFVIFKSSSISNIEAGKEVVYVYADILQHVAVGDTMVPLLRIVDLDSADHGGGKALLRRTFDRPFYMPLRMHNFDTIEILIKGEYGSNHPFISTGRTIATLHFRQAKESSYVY